MKIRPSLRLYFLVSLLLVGSITIVSFSALGVDSFVKGLNASMRQVMLDVAELDLTENGKLTENLTYHLASRWQDLPVEIKENFPSEPEELDKLYSYFVHDSLFGPPIEGYFLLKTINSRNEVRYITKSISALNKTKIVKNFPKQHIYLAAYALIALVAFAVFVKWLIGKIARPIERLKEWAKALDKQNLQKPAPDFDYSELNSLAGLVKNSLSSVQQSLDREQEFLSYASHELRTPIAVIRTNSELLNKMMQVDKTPEKQTEVLERILRASLTMTDLTETLLWLNRSEDKTLTTNSIQLGDLTEQLVHDLGYLLNGKKVAVDLSIDEQFFELPATLCRIVIGNLIRNAFQHTSEGNVSIIQTGKQLRITNQNINTDDANEALGFGLGLQLTEKLIEQYQWDFDSNHIEGGRAVSLIF